jgi:hypothetical protein
MASAKSFGVAPAEQATEFWGIDWLVPVGVPIIGADKVVAAATGITRKKVVLL